MDARLPSPSNARDKIFNPLSTRLGWHPAVHNTAAAMDEWLDWVERNVDMMLIVEKMDRSLLLMGRCLGLNSSELVPPEQVEPPSALHTQPARACRTSRAELP